MNLSNRKVAILGAQRSGLALAKLVLCAGGIPKLSEKSDLSSLCAETLTWIKKNKVPFEHGGHTQGFIEGSDLVVLSPGVRFDSSIVSWAKNENIPVLGEIEFSSQFCEAPIIAVTGSNGKTTTVTLIHQVLVKAGIRSCLCGNVGIPFAEVVLSSKKYDHVVLEVSSFQLESLLPLKSPFRKKKRRNDLCFKGFAPRISVILNVNQNHLDRHKDMEEYFASKSMIFLNQGKNDLAVLNFQDQRLKALKSKIKPKICFFNDPKLRNIFGITNPNQLAVLEVAEALKIDPKIVVKVLKGFKGVEHRLEFVRELAGVVYINDSKATTTESGRWALNSFDQPIVMICGGRDKNMDFTVLSHIVKQKVRKMIVIGEAKEKIMNSFKNVVDVNECKTLEDAVLHARKVAQRGDCVLFAPMCTSFDMFKDFEDRGRKYKTIVNGLK